MNDDIYFTLEKLEASSKDDLLLKSRIILELAQFSWINYKEPHNKFKL